MSLYSQMQESDRMFEAYKLTIKARNFHYANFNKWMTFFYVAIGAVFISYYTLLSKQTINNNSKEQLLVISGVGYFISILGYLSCKGYYFWIIHWTKQLNMFEERMGNGDFRVYSSFSKVDNDILMPTKPANISTSKISLIFFFGISVTWGYLIIRELNLCTSCNILGELLSLVLSIFSVCSILFCIGIGGFFESYIAGHIGTVDTFKTKPN